MTNARRLVQRCPTCGDWLPSSRLPTHLTNCSQAKQWESIEEYLSANGPTPNSILNERGFTVAESEPQLNVFRPHGLTARGNVSRTVYLPDHSPETVIRVWTASNESEFDTVSRSSITRRVGELYGDEWKTAWKQVADDFGLDTHQQAPEEASADPLKSCPKCGKDIESRKFVRHVRNCD